MNQKTRVRKAGHEEEATRFVMSKKGGGMEREEVQ